MEIAIKFISVTCLSILELWAAIPAGLALSLHPVLVAIASSIGAFIGALGVILLGDALQKRLLKKKNRKRDRKGRIYGIWERYGVVGLGLLSPLITGALLGAAIGISLGAKPRRLLLWMGIGIVLWAIVLTAIGVLGIAGLRLSSFGV